MRIVLTLIAVVLVAALSAALVGPLFIDWSAKRGFIETELARRLGAPVEIAGRIEARLLPTPYLTLGKVTVGEQSSSAEPLLRSDGMRFELALGGLFGGQIRFTEVTLDRPVAHFTLESEKPLAGWRAEIVALARRVALDRIVIEHGRVAIDREGAAPLAFSEIALDASAKSLIGPFRGSGEATSSARGGRAQFQFATADIADAGLPIKAEIWGDADAPRAVFDGELSLAADGGLAPVYAGAVTLTGTTPEFDPGAGPWPWKVSGVVLAADRQAKLDNLQAHVGPDARALEATGSIEAHWGTTFDIRARLQSKQLNLDALLRHAKEDSAPPARFLAMLDKLVERSAGFGGPMPNMSLEFSTPSVFLGAQTLDQLSLTASSKPGEPLTGHFETNLPGQSRVSLTGAVELGAGAGFRGKLDGQISDLRTLGDWASEGEPDLAAKLAALDEALPSGVASANGDIEASSVGFSDRNLNLAVDRTNFTGAIAFTRALGDDRGRLFVDLRSDGLDMDVAPNLEASADWLGDVDLSLALQATKLRVARVGQTSLDGGSLMLKATKSGPKLSLDQFSLADLGGATIEAQAESSPTARWARVRLDAARLRDFAALVARVAPGRYSRMLVDRADSLSPAKATFEARRDGPPLEGAFPLDFLKTEGEAGQSRFSLKLSRAPAPVDALAADLSLDAADGAVLLRQLGAKIPSGSAGRAHVAATASGQWESGFDAQLGASLVGANLNWRGRVMPDSGPNDPSVFGAATLKSDNVLNVLTVFGLVAPNSGAVAPADLTADFVVRGADAATPRISGALAGAKLTGNLAWKAPAAATLDSDVAVARSVAGEAPVLEPAHVSGELSLDRASASAMLALGLGLSAPTKSGARWSDAKFAPAVLLPPSTDVRLKVAALDLMDGTQARNFTARLRMDPAKFDFDEAAMDIASGRAAGRLTLRRDGPMAAATGQIVLERIGVDRPALRARLGASLDFAGTGPSVAALVAGMVGQGQVTLAGATIPRLDPGALGRVMAKVEAPDASIDETNITHSLGLELDKQSLALPDGAAPATLSSGVLHVSPIIVAGTTGHASASGDFDLRGLELGIRVDLEEAHADKFWSGSPPAATVTVRGGLDAPSRKIDDAILVAGLAAQAITRESDRIAALESDLRERAYFNRRMKAEHFLERRRAELAEFAIDQARLKNEAERKRVETELMKTLEDQQKAAADAAAARAPVPAPTPSPAEPAPLVRAAPPDAAPKPKPDDFDPTASGLY